MKKVMVITLGLALCLLVACSAPPDSSTSLDQPSTPVTSQPAAAQIEPDTEYSAQGGKGEITLLWEDGPRGENEEIVLSLAQQQAVAQQVQDVVLRYVSGEYPMPMPQGTEAEGFYARWPLNVDIPHTVEAAQLRFVTEGYETRDLGVQLPLEDDWRMECTLYTEAGDYTSTDAEWLVMAVAFVDGNGVRYVT